MPTNVMTIVLSIIVGLQGIVFTILIYVMYKQNRELLSYIMSKQDVGAYMASKVSAKAIASPKKVQDKTVERKYNEFVDIYNSGEITDEQEKRFGGREPIIQ